MEAKILLLKKLGGDFSSPSRVDEGRGQWWQVRSVSFHDCEHATCICAVPAATGKDRAVLTNAILAF